MHDLLDGKYMPKKIKVALKTYKRFPSIINIALGINKDLSKNFHHLNFPLEKPITIEKGKNTITRLSVRMYHFDPQSTPKGKTSVIIIIPTYNDKYWSNLKNNSYSEYIKEKEYLATEIIQALENEIIGIKDAVEVIDIATPDTIKRYTNNWHGSFEGFLPTRKTMMKKLPNTLDNLNNFYIHNQWLHPGGGVPPAGRGGREIAKAICKKDGKIFKIK